MVTWFESLVLLLIGLGFVGLVLIVDGICEIYRIRKRMKDDDL